MNEERRCVAEALRENGWKVAYLTFDPTPFTLPIGVAGHNDRYYIYPPLHRGEPRVFLLSDRARETGVFVESPIPPTPRQAAEVLSKHGIPSLEMTSEQARHGEPRVVLPLRRESQVKAQVSAQDERKVAVSTQLNQNVEEIKDLFEEAGWEAEEVGTGKVVGRWGALTEQGVGRYAIIAREPVVTSWHELVDREETLWHFTILDHHGDLGIVTAEVFFLPSPEEAAELLERHGLPINGGIVHAIREDTQ